MSITAGSSSLPLMCVTFSAFSVYTIFYFCFADNCGKGKEYKVLSMGEACIQCQPGTYKDTVGNEACKPCQPGYTSVETGQESCDICKFS